VGLGLSEYPRQQTTVCSWHFFVKKLEDTGWGLHFQGV